MHHKWQSNVWFLRYRAQQTEFFVIWDNFLLIYPLKTWKIQILKKWKKRPGYIIILHKCAKNQDHMLQCSWDMASDGCNHFSFWAIFCPFTPLKAAQKMKIKKKYILSFYTIVPKITIIWYIVPEIWCMTDVIVIFHFGIFFALLPRLEPKKSKLKKNFKKCLEISSFYLCVPKIMIRWCTVPEILCMTDGWTDGRTDGRMDRWMDGRKKWYIEVGAPPKKQETDKEGLF